MSLAAPLRAGHVEVPVGELGGQGSQSGAAGAGLNAPVPLQLVVPTLNGSGAPNLASVLAVTPAPQPVAAHSAAARPVTPAVGAAVAAVPALPEPAIPSPKGAAATPASKTAQSFEPVESAEAGADEGRALFDQGGAAKPLGFNRGDGKISDPALLPEKIYTPAIMREARRSGRVFELDRKSLKRLEPGVAHNFVIVQYRDGTIGMTAGRLNGVDEVGVKHAALGEGREVLFSGTIRVDPATLRPVLDFNSGVYSMAGLDARWAPTPQNARALAAHAEAILGTSVDVFDHIQNKPVDFRSKTPAGGLRSRLHALLSFGEAAPAWPGKTGDAVRVGRVRTELGEHAGDGGTSTVWRSRNGAYAIKILHPEARTVPGVEEEAATLRAISGSGLPVARLVAESRDGRILVKEFVEGDTAYALMKRGRFDRQHIKGWAELAAQLIRSGVTADLAPGNLVWQQRRARWVILDAGGLKDGGAADVLKQMLTPASQKAGVDARALLSGLRTRLGGDSAAWTKTLAAIEGTPELARLHSLAVSLKDAPALSAKERFFEIADLGVMAFGLQILSGVFFAIAGAHASYPAAAGALWVLGGAALIQQLGALRSVVVGGWQASHDQRYRVDTNTGQLRDVRGHKYGSDRYEAKLPGPVSAREQAVIDAIAILLGLPWVLGGGPAAVGVYLLSAATALFLRRLWRRSRPLPETATPGDANYEIDR